MWVNTTSDNMYAKHRQPFDEIKHPQHSMRLAMSQKVGMIGRLTEDEVESTCNPFITFT